MNSLLNRNRPPAFCPGCSHDQVVRALDQALDALELPARKIAIVSDIGCSGLFDTYFDTHAFHGLHGRALTYAAGLKLARPGLNVITVMGDGGLGIGGAHVLSACRRNLNLTLLVLNNFNYGMTGGQCSATTPQDAQTASGFLAQLEKPLDICRVAEAAGAPYVNRVSATRKDLSRQLEKAILYDGFSLVDIQGLCTGRYLKRNPRTQKKLKAQSDSLAEYTGVVSRNERPEYGVSYSEHARRQNTAPPPLTVAMQFSPLFADRREVVIMGAAGQRINTAGEILCLAAMSSGLYASQKSDYPITVLRGHSISEVVLSQRPINYTGLQSPQVAIALSPEGVARRKQLFEALADHAVVIKAKGLDLPATAAKVLSVDFKKRSIKRSDWALAAMVVLADHGGVVSPDMLKTALDRRFEGNRRVQARSIIENMALAV